MKCDQCDNEATVHEVTVRNGVKIEKHLCEVCATQQGIATQPAAPINELLKSFMIPTTAAIVGPRPPQPRVIACPVCQMTFAEFKQQGLLGCAACYKAFEAQLAPLVERAHDGGTKHIGKVPRRMLGGGTADTAEPDRIKRGLLDVEERAERLRRIQRELDNAVQAEQYERAAQLRDELRRLSSNGGSN